MEARAHDTWTRTLYRHGGGDAFLFYVVYLGVDAEPTLAVDSKRHRTRGLPEGLVMVARGRDEPSYTHADFARFASEEATRTAADAAFQFVIAGNVADPSDLLYLRDTLGIIAALLDARATAVFDVQTLRVFTAEEFRETFLADDVFDFREHVVPMRSEEADGTLWFHTRGLRKFGRPDVSVERVPEPLAALAEILVDRFTALEVAGGHIEEGAAIRVAGWPDGWTCHVGGSLDDQDFNNVHVAVREARVPR